MNDDFQLFVGVEVETLLERGSRPIQLWTQAVTVDSLGLLTTRAYAVSVI